MGKKAPKKTAGSGQSFASARSSGFQHGKGASSQFKHSAKLVGQSNFPSQSVDDDVDCNMKKLIMLKRAGQWELSLRMLHHMRKTGSETTAPEFSVVMSCLNSCEQPDRALELFDTMLQDAMEPTATCYEDAICACGLKHQPERAMQLFKEMESKALCPTARSYAAIIEAHAQSNLQETCWQIYKTAIAKGIPMTSHFFKVVAESLPETRLREIAMDLFRAMQSQRIAPSHLIQNKLICAYKSKLPDFMVKHFWELRAQGHTLSSTAYRCVMAAHERNEPE